VAAGKSLAFFTGSRPEYSKVISLRDTIADFTITGIIEFRIEALDAADLFRSRGEESQGHEKQREKTFHPCVVTPRHAGSNPQSGEASGGLHGLTRSP
nr:hypothetical protein [Verrucomicrobiota bacterium]